MMSEWREDPGMMPSAMSKRYRLIIMERKAQRWSVVYLAITGQVTFPPHVSSVSAS